MTKDMFDWEDVVTYPVFTTVVLQTIKPDDQLQIKTGFICIDNVLYLPEENLSQRLDPASHALQIADKYLECDARWAHKHFVSFFDSIHNEESRKIRLAFKFRVPENVNVSESLEWKTYNELARTNQKIAGDHDRIFRTAFNFQ